VKVHRRQLVGALQEQRYSSGWREGDHRKSRGGGTGRRRTFRQVSNCGGKRGKNVSLRPRLTTVGGATRNRTGGEKLTLRGTALWTNVQKEKTKNLVKERRDHWADRATQPGKKFTWGGRKRRGHTRLWNPKGGGPMGDQ